MAKQRTSAEIRRHLDDSLDSVVSAVTSTMSPDGAEQIKRWRVTFALTLDLLIITTAREVVEAEQAGLAEAASLVSTLAKDGA